MREALAAFGFLFLIVLFLCVAGLTFAGAVSLGYYWFGG